MQIRNSKFVRKMLPCNVNVGRKDSSWIYQNTVTNSLFGYANELKD